MSMTRSRALAVRDDEHLPLPVRAGHDRAGVPDRDPADGLVPHPASPELQRLTRFFGVLLLINVAVGVVTGLVQEFEFGMNWSAYSRFVGDVFGAPLAMEGLAAFFLESTFLGLWMFGWDRLPKRVHLACIWLVAARLDARRRCSSSPPTRGCSIRSATRSTRPRTSPSSTTFCALFTNPTFLWGYVHVILASLVTGSLVMLAVSAWYLRRKVEVEAFKRSTQARVDRADPVARAGAVRRQRARRRRGQVPADEDRRRRGAMEHVPAVLVLGVSDRRRQERHDADEGDRDPRICCRSSPPTPSRARSSASTSCSSSTPSSTAPATTSRTCSSSTGRCG